MSLIKGVVEDILKPSEHTKEYALVYWMQEKKTSVIPVTNIPEKDREEDKETSARWGGKSYPVKIIEISSEYMAL